MAASIDELTLELGELRISFERFINEKQKDDDALEETVWTFYSRLERVAAIMKLRLSVEEPPHKISMPKSEGSPLEYLDAALDHLKAADDHLNSGDSSSVLRSAQAARNSLRCYLSEKRRVRASEARSKRRTSRSRSLLSSS